VRSLILWVRRAVQDFRAARLGHLLALGKSHRADDLRFFCLFLFVDYAQGVVLTQRLDHFGQLLVGDAAAKLPIEDIDRSLAKRVAVDFLHSFSEFGGVEQRHRSPICRRSVSLRNCVPITKFTGIWKPYA